MNPLATPLRFAALLAASAWPSLAAAQSSPDRTDPTLVDEARPPRPDARPKAKSPTVTSPAADPVTSGTVRVEVVRLDGLQALSERDFVEAIAPWLNVSLDPQDQARLLRAIVEVARARGYPLTTVMIERQADTGGELRVTIDEGRIAGVRFSGQRHALVAEILGKLADGMPVTRARLERALRLAETLPGVRIRKVSVAQEGALNVLVADMTVDKIAGDVAIDNWGTSQIGPVIASATAAARGVIRPGDEATLTLTTVPLDPKEYVSVGGRYALPLDANGTRVALSGSVGVSRGSGSASNAAFDGVGTRVGVSVTHPLILRRTSRLNGTLGLSLRDTETMQNGIVVRNDRVTLLTGQLDGYTLVGSGYLSGRIQLVHGPGWFNATREGDPLASRRDGSSRFTKIELRTALDGKLAGPLSFALDAEAQFASRPLLLGDEFGIGGATFGRGYDYREASGDNALAGSAELRLNLAGLKLPLARAQIYAYGDAAHVWDLRGGDTPDSLFSAGGGLRASVTRNLGLGLEVGVPIDNVASPRGSFTTWVKF